MISDLESVTITDFRSIRGTISIPLAAPIVLIHGSNGAGKTSVLSALELAMTGDVATMRHEDDQFLNYLVHEGAERAEVRLDGRNTVPKGGSQPGSMIVVDGRITGQPMLDRLQAAFFAERCYLAQSVLSRLLEIYQHADPRADSPLTRFVKDLLGLDQLDALIDGLHAAENVRRIRNLIPEFRAAEDRCKALRTQRVAAERDGVQLSESELSQYQAFASLIAALPREQVGSVPPLGDLAQMKTLVESVSEDAALIQLAQYRRELASIRNSWSSLASNPSAHERVDAEQEEAIASAAAHEWRGTVGIKFETLLDQLRASFPDLPSWVSAGPLLAYDTALARVRADLQRQNVTLVRDRDAALKVQNLDEGIQKAEARIKLVDEQFGALTQDAGEVARALAGITPHIHGQDCPVCGRDFGEVSAEPLLGRLQEKIASLTEQAGRLSALSGVKSAEVTRLATLQRERETEAGKQLDAADRLAHQANVARLTSSIQTLFEWKNDIAVGSSLLKRHSDAQRRLSEARDRDRLATDLRRGVQRLTESLRQPPLGDSESLLAALDRLDQFVLTEQGRLTHLQKTRADALLACADLAHTEELAEAHETSVANLVDELRAAIAADSAAERRMRQARAMAQAAREARTAIVRRVFNESLTVMPFGTIYSLGWHRQNHLYRHLDFRRRLVASLRHWKRSIGRGCEGAHRVRCSVPATSTPLH